MKTTNNMAISFGKPISAPCLIPVLHASTPRCISDPFMVDGKKYKVTAISFGTPHGAVFVNDIEKVDLPLLGSSLGTHVLFPMGASIVFIEVVDSDTVNARLWQRDKGETPYTLEAACVAATVSIMLHKIMKYSVNVVMGGKIFNVEWDRMRDMVLVEPLEKMP